MGVFEDATGVGPAGTPDESPSAPRRMPRIKGGHLPYPEWTPPPLPSGPLPSVPSGSVTRSSGGATALATVTTGRRIPILYGEMTFAPDVVQISPASSDRWKFDVVVSEGPIQEISSPTAESWVSVLVTSLGPLTAAPSGMLTAMVGVAGFALTTNPWGVWEPRCTAKGRILYDPRIGAWGAGEYPASASCAYSKNPALIMADLLTFPQYGLGVDPAEVDWDTVEAAANYCDEMIDGAKRYEVSILIQSAGSSEEWMQTIGLHAGLRWRQSAGLWRLDYQATGVTPSDIITEDDVVAGSRPSVRYGAGSGLSGLPNRFTAEWTKVVYTSSTIEATTYSMPEVNAGAAIRDGATYRLHGFQSEVMAQRALQRIAAEIWAEVELDLTLTLDFLHLSIGTVFTANLPSLGLIDVDFVIIRMTYDAETVQIIANLYLSETWGAPTAGAMDSPLPYGYSDPTTGSLPSPPPPAPVAVPTPPVITAPEVPPYYPLYRSPSVDTPADGEIGVWDAASGTVRWEPAGTGGGAAPTLAVEEFEATAAQTDFVLAAAPIAGGLLYVTRDGIVARASDYTLTDDTIAFDAGLDAGTLVQAAYWSAAEEGTFALGEAFTATEGQTEFTLTNTPTTVILVSLNGVIQRTAAYDIVNGTTLTFATGLVADDDVWISYLY